MAKQKAIKGNGFSKPKRDFGDPMQAGKPNHRFIPVPSQFKKPSDLTLKIEDVVEKKVIDSITKAKKQVFHMVGDTGGIKGTEMQEEIAHLMESHMNDSTGSGRPAFFYHLGDVVYFNGMSKDYEPQFYEPYTDYHAPIFAIPGNHDCDTATRKDDQKDDEPSLYGFMTNFCDDKSRYSPNSPYRKSMNQPWPYWVLDTPFATIIGLFSNVDGSLDKPNDGTEQLDWFTEQMKKAPKNKCLIVTVHHPCFSLDSSHGGYPLILQDIDAASSKAGRHPDAVFSGHVHNYQRFTRTIGSAKIPFVIAGAGGYANTPLSMHHMQRNPNKDHIKTNPPFQTKRKDVVLNYYNQTTPGFLELSIDSQFLHCAYYTVNFNGSEPPTAPDDEFMLDWKQHKLVPLE